MYDEHGKLHGVEAVIDKDLASALLAEELHADLLVIATDVDGVYTGWGTPQQARLARVTPDDLAGLDLPAGSMGPKVVAHAASPATRVRKLSSGRSPTSPTSSRAQREPGCVS